MLRLYLYARVRTFLCILRTRPLVQHAPGIPCSLSFSRDEKFQQTSGAMRRENADAHTTVVTRLVRKRGGVTQYSRDVND